MTLVAMNQQVTQQFLIFGGLQAFQGIVPIASGKFPK
jgi:hypothetical protein